eukprot:993369-Ditylum_brightwellii.AAC.1
MKDPEPQELCEPAKHQGICMPEPHKLCEPEQHQKVWQEYDSKTKHLNTKGNRKRDQRGINNSPA